MTIDIKYAKRLPKSPGVYLMKDMENRVIYVGKASSLRDRVSQYFRESDSPKTRMLVRNINGLEYIVTGTEVEALVLESNLIKEHAPRYNVKLRDDKAYPFIRITNDEYPRICIARRRERDGAAYYGPYPGSRAVRELIKMASRLGIRRCRKKLPCPPCLNYHIKQCAAPCAGIVSKEEYLGIIRNVSELLKGRHNQLIQSLTHEMELLSKDQEYEKAAHLRDQINALQEISEKQRVNVPGQKEQDVLAYAIAGEKAALQVFHVSEGKLRGRDTFTLTTAGSDENEMLSSFIKQYYLDAIPPQELIIPVEISDGSISLWLEGLGSKLKTPKNAVEKGLMNLAQENARMLLGQELLHEGKNEALLALQNALALPAAPSVIEAFDISNISGTDATGSLVAFENGKPDKKNYRRFKIKTVEGADDFAMMGEVVGRAYARRKEEGKRMPDLVLIDGGKGQLNAALAAIGSLGLSLDVAALAKEFEYIFLPGKEAPVILPEGSPARKLVQRIRDEAHRFALGYHRKLRGKRIVESELDKVAGIGVKKKQALLRYFGSVEKLRKADVEEIGKVPGVSRKDAEGVWRYFGK
ncbi:MAG: excinuclease ABC subunit UvrC [Euryarchaeota archaeon]|nr:excinuclease ABC subunit UvrC [Euryarchaeota archaeon]MBU4220108.1 excinuclease ABC subunit UvrC [Euryarchaeota archaeon]MBU4339843.1 excinuclease ABC subunit UvrC [Euryarchaeota archaeon]MBU4454791.1 excinuclease ABC subunit UvrC [Euryarchaeota archaeon]